MERKREKVLKEIDKCAFLDILMGGSKSIPVDNNVKNETQDTVKVKEKVSTSYFEIYILIPETRSIKTK